MTRSLEERRIAFVATDGVEQVELERPWEVLSRAGGRPVLVSVEAGRIRAFDHLEQADPFPVDLVAADAAPEAFDAIVLPGGVASPDKLRMDEATVAFVGRAVRLGLPVAVICHGPWTLVEADVVRGRTLTSYPSVATDLRNAGANWVDREVAVCDRGPNVIVSSRRPGDLDAFCEAMIEQFTSVPVHSS